MRLARSSTVFNAVLPSQSCHAHIVSSVTTVGPCHHARKIRAKYWKSSFSGHFHMRSVYPFPYYESLRVNGAEACVPPEASHLFDSSSESSSKIRATGASVDLNIATFSEVKTTSSLSPSSS